jgi:hypothetical protein
MDINSISEQMELSRSSSDNYQIKKVDSGFVICFSVENNNLDLVSIFGFPILDILHIVNKDDLIDMYSREVVTEEIDANVKIIFKHLFKDIGMPQFYMNMFFQCIKSDSTITYKCVPNTNISGEYKDEQNISSYNMHIPVSSMKVTCTFPSQHKANCEVNVNLDSSYSRLSQHESMIMSIFKKMFNKVKRFIEMSV